MNNSGFLCFFISVNEICFSAFETLPEKVQEILKNPSSRIYVSSVSIWEISIKKGLGKLESPDNLIELINRYFFTEITISFAHAQKVEMLPDIHRDPFDRLLIAQSQVENIPIITKDGIIPRYEVETIWN